MSASAADRRHTRAVELAMELQVAVADEIVADRRCDLARGRTRRYAAATRDWIRERISSIPGGRRLWQLLAGLFDGMRTEDALEALEDRKRDRVRELSHELAGVLDPTDAVVIAIEVA